MEEEDDEIVKEMPVYLSQDLANQLYIFQYPVKPSSCNFDKAHVINSRMKPNHQEVRLEFALDTTSANYDSSKGEQIAINTDGAMELEERRNKNAANFASPQQRCESALSQRSSHSLYSPARLNDLRNVPGPRSASLEMILEPLIQSTQGQNH